MVLASKPRATATHYVLNDPAEICFSPILNPGDQYTVYFEAPKKTGRYRFLCTYPGHWQVMRGSLFVLPDGQPLPPPTADEMTRKFIRQWKLTDLADQAGNVAGRNASHGRTVFTQAGWIKCHKVGTVGTKLGPDLSDVIKRMKGQKLLQQILEPSTEINKQYQTWMVVDVNGKVRTGLLTSKNERSVTLMANPLKPEQTLTIDRSEIDEIIPSKRSTMPDGLLMTFSRDEILDLLSYLQAGTSE